MLKNHMRIGLGASRYEERGRRSGGSLDLTVLIPALNEASNLRSLLPDVARVLGELSVVSEIVVVDGGSSPDTRQVAESVSARLLRQTSRGYGGALAEGFDAAMGDYVLTMDADYSHEPALIRTLWRHRREADLLIASRYVAGGSAESGAFRASLSRLLNGVYRRFLRLPFRDLSSGFRLYRMEALRSVAPVGRDFDFLPEVLVLLHASGLRIREVPFRYRPRREGRSRVKLFRFGWAYLKTLLRMKRLQKRGLARATPDAELRVPEPRGTLDGLRDGSGAR
jgi:glycosyltransferase involved in cell wall biosynthesis